MRTGLTSLLRPGTCAQCGCTETMPCVDPDTGDCCSWTDREERLCSVCPLLVWRAWQLEAVDGVSWLPAYEGQMIVGMMRLEMAIAIAVANLQEHRLASVCARCVDPEFRIWATQNGLPNLSHGLCEPCLEAAIAELEETRKVVAA